MKPMITITGFECKYYGSKELSFHPGYDAKEILAEIIEIESNTPQILRSKFTWKYIAGGIGVLYDGFHLGNIKPAYKTKVKIECLHTIFMNIGSK